MIDFAAAAPAIADSLEAAGLLPPRTPGDRRKDERRHGAKGSLVIHVGGPRAGTWRDFEAGTGGGMLDLVGQCTGLDRRGAFRWLRERGLLADHRPGFPSGRPNLVFNTSRSMHASARESHRSRDEKDTRAQALLDASEPLAAVPHPVQLWRLGLIGAAGNPPCLRWIDAAHLVDLPRVAPAPKAAGALLAPLAPLDAWIDSDTPIPTHTTGVQLIYIRGDGQPGRDAGGADKRTYGATKGCCWAVLSAGGVDCVRLAEGIADGLALYTCHGSAIATVGSWNMPSIAAAAERRGVDITAHLDGDDAGRKAAASVLEVAPTTHLLLHAARSDPAAAWERAIRRTRDGRRNE